MCHPKKLPTWCWWCTGQQSFREPRMLFLFQNIYWEATIRMWLIFSTDSPEIIVKTHKDDDVNEDVDDDVDDDSIEDPEVTALGGDWYVPVLRARGSLSLSRYFHIILLHFSRRRHWSFVALLFHLDFLTQLLKISPVTSDIRMLENQKKVMTLFIILPVPP